jgi:hypothetical protein
VLFVHPPFGFRKEIAMSTTVHTDHGAVSQCHEIDAGLVFAEGCESFDDCPRSAEWLVVFSRAGIRPQTICEEHRPAFTYLLSVEYDIGINEFRFVQIRSRATAVAPATHA